MRIIEVKNVLDCPYWVPTSYDCGLEENGPIYCGKYDYSKFPEDCPLKKLKDFDYEQFKKYLKEEK